MPVTLTPGAFPGLDPASADARRANDGGALDASQVFIQFCCSTDGEGGGHDPEKAPDEKVRPEHAALHGTIWAIDDPGAPIPPCDYGCRCAIRYLGKPDTQAATILPEAPSEPTTTPAPAFRKFLDKRAPGWKDIANAMAQAEPGDELAVGYAKAKELGLKGDRRALVRMISQAEPEAGTVTPPPPTPPPAPALPVETPPEPLPPVPTAPAADPHAELVKQLEALASEPAGPQRKAKALQLLAQPEATRTVAVVTIPASRQTPAITQGIDLFRSLASKAVLPDDRKLTVVASRRARSFARPTVDEVHLSAKDPVGVVVHELGHLLEKDPKAQKAAQEFLARRTAGEKAQSLRKLTGKRYAKSEVTKRDGFIDPYVGKIYSTGHTEVISMGLEFMSADPILFLQQDPDHFRFIAQLLRGTFVP